MRFFRQLALAASAGLVGQTLAVPLVVQPGNAGDIIITKQNTINATTPAPSNMTVAQPMVDAVQRLQLCLVNNIGGSAMNAYVTGLDPSNRLVMLQPDGSWYYPAAGGSSTPIPITANLAIPLGGKGSRKTVYLPSYLSSGRIWFAEGRLKFYTVQLAGQSGPSLVTPSAVNPSDPSAGINWGFVELTNTAAGGLYANISYVDFVGIVLGMILKTVGGGEQAARGLQAGAVARICADLKAQSARDGRPWGALCVRSRTGTPLRVLSPTDYMSMRASRFDSYFARYVDRVWARHAATPLTIDTQGAAGRVACRVAAGVLRCAGDNRGYARPSAADIFGCNSGPFAILSGDNDVHRAVVPRLCAAFHRSSFFAAGGNVQPGPGVAEYYAVRPTNFYSKTVHRYELDGKGYAFAYDDVNPSGDVNQSGVVASAQPKLLTITVGGAA